MENKEINKVIAEEMKGPVCCPMIHEIARTISENIDDASEYCFDNDEGQTIKLVKPTEPETPTTPTPKKTVIPKTGDTTNILLPSAILAVAASCFIYVIRRRKKH